MTKQKSDSLATTQLNEETTCVLKYLDSIDERIKNIQTYKGHIPGVYQYLKLLPEITAGIRQQIKSGDPYFREFIRLTELLVQMQWSFFVYFEPLIAEALGTRDRLQKNAATGPKKRNETSSPVRDYCRKLAKDEYYGIKIREAATLIFDDWDKNCGVQDRQDMLKKKPSVGTLRRWIEDLFPERLRSNRAKPSSRAYICLVPPTWGDACALRNAQHITPLNPGNLSIQYKKRRLRSH